MITSFKQQVSGMMLQTVLRFSRSFVIILIPLDPNVLFTQRNYDYLSWNSDPRHPNLCTERSVILWNNMRHFVDFENLNVHVRNKKNSYFVFQKTKSPVLWIQWRGLEWFVEGRVPTFSIDNSTSCLPALKRTDRLLSCLPALKRTGSLLSCLPSLKRTGSLLTFQRETCWLFERKRWGSNSLPALKYAHT